MSPSAGRGVIGGAGGPVALLSGFEGYPLWRQLKRDCEGLPPFTWGLGLCPNFLISCWPPAAASKKREKSFSGLPAPQAGSPEAPAGRLGASLRPPHEAKTGKWVPKEVVS